MSQTMSMISDSDSKLIGAAQVPDGGLHAHDVAFAEVYRAIVLGAHPGNAQGARSPLGTALPPAVVLSPHPLWDVQPHERSDRAVRP